MIARGSPVGAVCFRCRLRLLRQLTPIRYVASDATTAPQRAHDDRTDGVNAGDDAGRDDAGHDEIVEFIGRSRTGVKRLDLRKRHLSGNRVLNEGTASLGSEMLGKPAYAIVMRDGGNIRKKQSLLGPNTNETEPSGNIAQTIEALLDSQRESPTLQEVRSNIQDLQPQTDKVLSNKDFRKLQNLLTEGFLSAQLQDYIEWRKADAERESKEIAAGAPSYPEFPWILEISPWVPLPTQPNSVDGTDLSLQGYVSDSTPAKEKLAIHLMRECWGLSIAELGTQLGETLIKLRKHEFVLLMRGTQRFMNTLGEIWLEPGEKIEAVRNQKTLRLVTSKSKAESLIRELDEILKSVTMKTFPVHLVASEVPDDAVLEEVGQITNSHVRKSHTLKRLHVTWIELKSRAAKSFTGLEDMAHIVFRLLLTASGSQQATSTLLSPNLANNFSGRLIEDLTSKDKLVWKDRLAKWARYVFPLTPKESIGVGAIPIKEFELPFEPLRQTRNLKDGLEFFPETQFPFHPVKWSNTLQTSTVAHFGQILHPYQPSTPTPLLSDLLASPNRRIFAPKTPHPLYLAQFDAPSEKGSPPLVITKSTLVLRFWPSPSSNPATKPDSSRNKNKKVSSHAGDTPPAPVLELRLATSDREVEGIESLRAIKCMHHTDVMLPSALVDVRFTQTQYETLQARDRTMLAAWQPLADFLKHARLDLEEGKLEMPPRQRFPVPRRLFATAPSSSPPTTTNSNSADEQAQQPQEEPDDLVSILYEFVGLELHRSASLPFEGHQLTYTSVEAGQGGGRRTEVTLEPVEFSTAPSSDYKLLLQDGFLACCSRFVMDHSLWSGIVSNKRK
ncbi:hypothetical protein HD806DRAFT_392466 [Xylariaceae sp. AK1471]|nr:hypothetical protein HD806DRAFT_392466 [Xylariaceae sp. AK1471]